MRAHAGQLLRPEVVPVAQYALLHIRMVKRQIGAELEALFEIGRAIIQRLRADTLIAETSGRQRHVDPALHRIRSRKETARPVELPINQILRYAVIDEIKEADVARDLVDLPGDGFALAEVL